MICFPTLKGSHIFRNSHRHEDFHFATIHGNESSDSAVASIKKTWKRVSTYSKIYIQVVFAVRHRTALLQSSWEDALYRYITGIVQNKEQLMIAINGNRDHIHILLSIRPSCRLSDLVREIKKASTEFVNSNRFVRGRFAWQEGYGAFSYSRWDVDRVTAYINNQKAHHRHTTFREEYVRFLNEFDIDYNDDYLFGWVDEETEV